MISYPVPPTWCIVIPSYNAGKHLDRLIKLIMRQYSFEPAQLVIVNDGSDDGSCSNLPIRKLTLLTHPVNEGKGRAMMSGWRYAQSRNYRYVLFMDADGQHPADSIRDFIGKSAGLDTDLIIGCREIDRHMPWTRKTSNLIGSLLVSLLLGHRILDTQSGFRLIRIATLVKFSYFSRRYELETEILFKFIRSGCRLDYVKIPTIYHAQSSHYRLLPDLMRFLRTLIRLSL
ncbi:MAG: glycosyltransferase family 2 protein [Candidatus Delongbacteria bacterium]|nr:glycosyltransferase family 2 protein [Candidatus Delongbacteria bacterium]